MLLIIRLGNILTAEAPPRPNRRLTQGVDKISSRYVGNANATKTAPMSVLVDQFNALTLVILTKFIRLYRADVRL